MRWPPLGPTARSGSLRRSRNTKGSLRNTSLTCAIRGMQRENGLGTTIHWQWASTLASFRTTRSHALAVFITRSRCITAASRLTVFTNIMLRGTARTLLVSIRCILTSRTSSTHNVCRHRRGARRQILFRKNVVIRHTGNISLRKQVMPSCPSKVNFGCSG